MARCELCGRWTRDPGCFACGYDRASGDTTHAVELARLEARTAKRWLKAVGVMVAALPVLYILGTVLPYNLDGLFVLFACSMPLVPPIAILAGRDLARANHRLRRANNIRGLPEARVIER